MPEISSPNKLPEGVTEEELYEGPEPGAAPENVVPIKPPMAVDLVAPIPPRPRPPEVSSVAELKKSYPAVLTAALDVLNARLLGLIAVIAACLIWGYAVYDPTQARTLAASLFSVTALLPLIVLYWRAGVTGQGG